ncbi:hypothetical protein TNCV_536891 [Trichonephila clavipes]|nr:hypothetical protein TNCV_536891 [Trichonephila clavipes]
MGLGLPPYTITIQSVKRRQQVEPVCAIDGGRKRVRTARAGGFRREYHSQAECFCVVKPKSIKIPKVTRSTNDRGFLGQRASELSACLGIVKCREEMQSEAVRGTLPIGRATRLPLRKRVARKKTTRIVNNISLISTRRSDLHVSQILST